MILTIHRGTHQIGGCVTELRTDTTCILIDLGSPLPGPDGAVPKEPLSLPGVTAPGTPCDGVFFTHNHGDHIGQIGCILPEVPLFLGETAREVALALPVQLGEDVLEADVLGVDTLSGLVDDGLGQPQAAGDGEGVGLARHPDEHPVSAYSTPEISAITALGARPCISSCAAM